MRCLCIPASAKVFSVWVLQDAVASAALVMALLMADCTTNMCSNAKVSLRNQMTPKRTPNEFVILTLLIYGYRRLHGKLLPAA